ncbi:MAG: hypothetical protein DMG65_00935 [Candidatus Angelobacter sp. Gp1-AA117]|nr:MAG: hypothetical protein DMG65_00935 [Candidatus Angelobacter sp. Gp1-AA117]
MNPFDIKSALLARHAQHVVLIHFPIALFMAAVAFDFRAMRNRSRLLAAATCYNLLVAAAASLPVLVTGILAWRWQLEGQRLQGVLLLHLLMGAASTLLIWLVWWIHMRAARSPERDLPAYRWPIQMVAVVIIVLTSHLGGILSGVNGPG